MESELPLMEMAEEDDSLIPDLNFNQTPSKSSLNYFACSPFALPPSHTKNLKASVCMEKPSSSSSEASNNKENINSNNVGVPKLGMESMQMKRRKKGGGYNLRKSIAWDRAFFTEEGILDPLELTLITGISANTRGGGLTTISEEGNSSFFSEVGCTNECNDTKVTEEAPLKEACDKNCISKGKKEKERCSVGNQESLPHHRVTQKVLSINRTKRDPLAASSLKRPANSDTLKTSKKESKLTIPPISKPGSCFSATKNVSMSASQLRRNLIPKPVINVQKNVGLKSSIQNVHGSHSKAKTGLGNLHKGKAQKTLRNLTNSSKAASTTKLRLQLCEIQQESAPLATDILTHRTAENSTNSSKAASTTKSRLQLCEIQQDSAPLAVDVLAHHTAENSRNSLPKTDILHPRESQEHPATLARQSGLRLPSPSLRFFDQSSPTTSYMVNTTKGVLDSNTSQNPEIKVIPRVDQNCDDRVPFVRETEDKFVLHNEENILHNDNYSAGLMSKSGQTIQYQEQQNISSGVDVNTDFTRDLAFASEDTEESGAFKVNPQSHLWVSPGLEYDLVDEKRWQEDFTGKNINQGNFSDFSGENQLSESKGFVEVDSEVVQGGKTPMLGDFQHGLDGGSEIKITPRVDQYNDDKVAFVREAEDIFVLHNEENILHNGNYSTSLMSKSGQPIQHQEHKNISSGVDVSTDFTHDLAQTSKDTEKSGAFKVNPESNLWVSPGLEYDSVDEKRGQEDVTGKTTNQGNFSDSNGENQPSESQGFVKVESEVVQEGKTPVLGDFHHGLEGGSEIKSIPRVDQYYDYRVAFVREAEDKFVLHNDENILHNDSYSTGLMSKSGQPIQHQEQQNISSGVDVSTDFTQDLAQTLKDTEKSGAFKVNPESNLWVSPGLEYDLVNEKREQEDVTGKNTNQGNFSDSNGENQLSESQGFVEVESEVFQEGKTPVLGDFHHGLDGSSEIKFLPRVDQYYDDRVAFVREAEDKFVLHNEENILHNDNYSTGLMSKSAQPIQHQDQQNISSGVDVSTDFTHDLAQTSKDTEKSDAFKVNPESHLWVSPGLEYDSVDEKSGQEDVTEKNINQGNFSDFNGENQPSEPQDFVKVDSEVVPEGKNPMLGDFQQAFDGGSDLNENKDACHATMVIKSSNSIKRQDNSLVMHPPNAVPFSDEWLAAIEAAGEEILTMKCGAVQHSPPDKSLPEPGPWSPVKKKSNQIGPYDCTKYANAMPSNAQ